MIGKLIKAFCSTGPDASWGMFVSSRKSFLMASARDKKNRLREKTGRVNLLLKGCGGVLTVGGETKG